MELLRSKIDQVRSNCTGGTVSLGTTNSTATVRGVPGTVGISVTISNVTGFASLRQVDVSAVWTESYRGGTRNDSMSFSTWVKPNET